MLFLRPLNGCPNRDFPRFGTRSWPRRRPVLTRANGQIRLGHAYLAAGQKADAIATFNKVKTPEKDANVAHLWALAARR